MEADPVLVLRDEREEPGELLLLAREVGVEQRVVAFAAAPQDVVLAAEPLRDLEHDLDLGRGIREDVRVGVRRGACRVSRVAEQVRRAPQELHPRALLVGSGLVHERQEVGARLGECRAVRSDVTVVEAVVGDPELREELEGGGEALPRGGHRVGSGEPWPVECTDPEHVLAVVREAVPEADADPEVVLHALPEDEAVRLVHLERKRVGRTESPERDPALDTREEITVHAPSLRAVSRPREIVLSQCSYAITEFVRKQHKSFAVGLRGAESTTSGPGWMGDGRRRRLAGDARRRRRAGGRVPECDRRASAEGQPPDRRRARLSDSNQARLGQAMSRRLR